MLVLTTYDTDADILPAIEAGATGYLLKDASRDELLDAVKDAAAGEAVLAAKVSSKLVRRVRQPRRAVLTAREIEVLRHAAADASNRDIASALYLTEATVKSHLLHAYDKLGVDSRTAAVTRALRLGIIDLADTASDGAP